MRFDARTRRTLRVQVGERIEHRQIGMHDEQVKIGERKERVQVGTRDERVLVRPETKHVVRIPVTIPGHMVWVGNDRAHQHGAGDVMSEVEYQAVLQQAQAFSATR